MAFKDLKKKRTSFEDLTKKLQESSSAGGGFKKDERQWYPELDQAKNGYAVIRFLPASEGNDLPWAKCYSHGFKDVGGWFIEECPTTIGKDCPVCSANSELWNTGIDADKNVARKRKRKLSYYANVYIVSDPKTPENEGQVRIFRFGKKIFDMIQGAVTPEFEDETPIDPFNLWEGANFKLKIREVDGNINYDKSEFDAPSQLLSTDKAMEAVYNSEFDMSEFTADDKYKSEADLTKKLDRVIGRKADTGTAESFQSEDAPQAGNSQDAPAQEEADSSDSDDTMSYFEKMASESESDS